MPLAIFRAVYSKDLHYATLTTMRIIAGKYRSRILKSLKGLALRPTSDRLRGILFHWLSWARLQFNGKQSKSLANVSGPEKRFSISACV